MRAQSRSGCGGGCAHGDVDAGGFKGGEELDQPVLERQRHLRGVVAQEEARELAVEIGRDGRFFGQHDGVAVAALNEFGGRAPPLGVLEDQDANGLRGFQVGVAD